MRLRIVCLSVVMGLLAGSAEGAPFTFQFVLPNWTPGIVVGALVPISGPTPLST